MKRAIVATLLAVALMPALTAQAQDAARLGYIDLRKVLLDSKTGKRNQAELQKLVQQKQEDLRQEEQKLKSFQQSLEKEAVIMTDQQKQQKQQEFGEKRQALQKMASAAEQEVRRKDAEYTQKALTEVRAIVVEIAREKKLLMVFDKAGQPFYAEPGPDLTDAVMQKYDAKSAK